MMPLTDTDLELLRRYIDGDDADAFAGIVRRHASLVFYTCLRVLGDRERAEDAAQETFHRLMRHPEKVNHSVAAWLHRVATRCSIDILRSDTARRKRELSYQQRLERRRQTAEPWPSVSGQIDEALAKLNPAQRDLLVAHFLEGKTQAELARAVGVSKATMSRRTEAALAALRQRLGRIAAAGLTAALTGLQAQASAAVPVTLSVELNKMAMLSGTAVAPAAVSVQVGTMTCKLSTVATLATVASVLVTGLMTFVLLNLQINPPYRSDVREGATAVRAAIAQPADQIKPPGSAELIYLRSPGESLRSDHVLAYTIEDDRVNIVFADSHVRSVSIDEARPMIETQAGVTLEQLAARAVLP